MPTLYIVSAAVAGVLLILSLLGADHSAEHDVHFDHGDHDAGSGHGRWIPFFSLRFYTYFFAGFGVTGLLVRFLTTVGETVTLWMALIVGLFAGLSVSILIRMLRAGETTSGASDKDVLGIEAQVLVAIRGASPGRIRCQVKGESIDYLAVCDDPTPIEPGSTVIVVAMEDGRALVMARSVLFDDDSVSARTS
jgi:membrane protein implicated in regulation of membrane protease activity